METLKIDDAFVKEALENAKRLGVVPCTGSYMDSSHRPTECCFIGALAFLAFPQSPRSNVGLVEYALDGDASDVIDNFDRWIEDNPDADWDDVYEWYTKGEWRCM